jgi:hypothetical protein
MIQIKYPLSFILLFDNIVPCWRYLLGYRPSHLIIHAPLFADYTRRCYNLQLQAFLTLTVSTIALSVDSRVPRRFPYCTVNLALSTIDSLEAGCRLTVSLTDSSPAGSLTLFAGWLADSPPAGSLALFAGWLAHSIFFFSSVEIRLKVACGGPDRSHLAQPFRHPLSRVGCWGNVCCVFTMRSSGFILGIANRYHGYNIVSLRRCVAVTISPAVG